MNTLKLNFHHDAGHGWLKVPEILMNSLLSHIVKTDLLSQFSYYSKRQKAYFLEEDRDAPRFMKLASQHLNLNIETVSIYDGNTSNIRNMDRAI